MKLDGNIGADRELGYAPLPGVPHGSLPPRTAKSRRRTVTGASRRNVRSVTGTAHGCERCFALRRAICQPEHRRAPYEMYAFSSVTKQTTAVELRYRTNPAREVSREAEPVGRDRLP